jgi:hypothetical protein
MMILNTSIQILLSSCLLGRIFKCLKESNQASRMRCDIILKALVLKIKLQPRRSLMTG